LFAADIPDAVDGNIYGTHPVYLETRYYEVDAESNDRTYVSDTNGTAKSSEFLSNSHLVFMRNVHGQEVLLRDSKIVWRSLGGTIDLYFYAGPSPEKAMSSYQQSAAGLPAMQQYWTFGYHQCRWGYTTIETVEDVVNKFAENDLPLETIWCKLLADGSG
jgi:alpha-glucosidase